MREGMLRRPILHERTAQGRKAFLQRWASFAKVMGTKFRKTAVVRYCCVGALKDTSGQTATGDQNPCGGLGLSIEPRALKDTSIISLAAFPVNRKVS